MKKLFILVFVSTIIMYWTYGDYATAEEMKKPLLVIRERHLRLTKRSDSPRFALYGNKEIIFFNPSCSWQSSFLHVTLDDYEFQNLLQYVHIPEEFSTLNTCYNFSHVLEDFTQEFYVHLDNKPPKKIVVAGHLRKPQLPKDIEVVTGEVYQQLRTSCGSQQPKPIWYVLRNALTEAKRQQKVPPKIVVVCGVEVDFRKAILAARYMRDVEQYYSIKEQCPKELTFLFDTLADYCHPFARPWLPENIEVMIEPANPLAETSVTDWPPEWPDLDDPATRKRGGDEYSLFLDSDEWEAFKDFLFRLRRDRVRINGRTWWVSYRFPFPKEEVWEKSVSNRICD
jgi:hypothetical protein